MSMDAVYLERTDALVIVDVQNDFLPGGNLAVAGGDEIIPILNRTIMLFNDYALPIFVTRDWHPHDHCSFTAQGGAWPPHCIANSKGAGFAAMLNVPSAAIVISKATTVMRDAYSGFEGTDLADRLHLQHIRRLFVGGLATDYCVLNTVKDALAQDFKVILLLDAIRAVDVHPGDGQAAINEMIKLGATPIHACDIERGSAGKYANPDLDPIPVGGVSCDGIDLRAEQDVGTRHSML